MDLRIFTEPQQGASYDDLLAVAQACRAPRLRRLLPQRPLPGHGDVPTACPARPTPGSRWPASPGRPSTIRLGTLVTAATFRLARAPGHHRGRGRRHERWPGGARASAPAWYDGRAHRLRHPLPAAGRALRAPGGAAGHRHRAVVDPRRGDRSPSRAPTTRWPTARPCPSRSSDPDRRSSSAAVARSGRPGWPPPTPPSSTWASRIPRATRRASSTWSAQACRGRRTAIRPPWSSRLARSSAAATTDAEIARRAAAIGRRGRRAAHQRAVRHAGRGGRQARPLRRKSAPRGSTCRSSTWPTSTIWPCSASRCCPGWPGC